MALSRIRPDVNIRRSRVYTDNVASGSAMESAPVFAEDDFNNIRSQINRIIKADVSGNWFDDVATVNSKKRGLFDLNTDLDAIEEARRLCPVQVLTDITVGGADNFVVLSVAGSETPSQVAAVDGGTALGAVVATLPGVSGTHSLNEVAGANAITPKNLVHIRDASTKENILSGGEQVYGLLQAESIVVDGDAFDDTTKQAQISFVINNGSDDLIACPAVDIQGSVVEYLYWTRTREVDLPEDCAFPLVNMSDQVAAVDVTRQNGYNNQGTTPVNLTTNAILDLEAAGISWVIRDDLEADLIKVLEGSLGGTSEFQIAGAVDTFNVDAVVNDFLNGLKTNTGGTRPIDVGVNDGIIESTAGDLEVQAAAELLFDDVNQTGSTWAQDGIKLSETTAEWDTFETLFGEVSLLNAIAQAAGGSLTRTKVQAEVSVATVTADTNVGGPASANNVDVDFTDMNGLTFVDDVDIYYNTGLLRNGANVGAAEDVYPGSVTTDLRFPFVLVGAGTSGNNDVITQVVWS